MMVSFILVVIFMIIYHVPISWNVLWFFPIILTTIIFTFGVCTLMMHIGVFVEDLSNVTTIVLRMLFYFTGVFYDISTRVHNEVYRKILLDLNPLANFIHNTRSVLIGSGSPIVMWTIFWFMVGLLLSILGVKIIYKYENTYVKVMK